MNHRPLRVRKSTSMRTLPVFCDFAQGEIKFPRRETVLFLPQKPYLPLGTLREAFLYPQGDSLVSMKTLLEVMADCKLTELENQLDTIENWSQILSLGEQQRVAFARILLQQPRWLFLDEATSALDEPTECAMYGLLKDRLQDALLSAWDIARRWPVITTSDCSWTKPASGL